jgi:hypothetical protein
MTQLPVEELANAMYFRVSTTRIRFCFVPTIGVTLVSPEQTFNKL